MNPFTRDIVVRFEHCDAAGIMFYPRFFALVNETVEDWFASLGHSFKALHIDQRKGVPTVRFNPSSYRPCAWAIRCGKAWALTLLAHRRSI